MKKYVKLFEEFTSEENTIETTPVASTEAPVTEEANEFDYKVEEGFFGKSDKEKEETLKADYNKMLAAWKAKGVKGLTPEEINAEVAKAKADKFEGKWGVDADKKMTYRNSKDVKWASPAGHTFGGGANA